MMLTVNQAAREIHSQYGGNVIPEYTMRRAVDVLVAEGKLTIERGHTGARMLNPKQLKPIVAYFRERNLLPEVASAS